MFPSTSCRTVGRQVEHGGDNDRRRRRTEPVDRSPHAVAVTEGVLPLHVGFGFALIDAAKGHPFKGLPKKADVVGGVQIVFGKEFQRRPFPHRD